MQSKKVDYSLIDMFSQDLHHFADSLPFYIIIIDEDHHILFANKAISAAIKVDLSKLIGSYCPKVIHGLNGPFPGCPLEESVSTGHAIEKELFDEKNNRWLKSAIYPTELKSKNGKKVFIHIVRDITDRKINEKAIEENYQTQKIISEILRISLLDTPIDNQLKLILKKILAIPWIAIVNKGAIFLVNNSDELIMQASYGLDESVLTECKRVPFGKCICGKTAISKKIEFAGCVDCRHEINLKNADPHGHYCIPILSSHKLLGVINLYLQPDKKKDEKEVDFLAIIADAVAGIIYRKQAEEKLHESLSLIKTMEGIIEVLILLSEARDPYTAGHQRRVARLACAIAKEMKLSKEKIEEIRLAASIHDLGKISIPSEILAKTGRLTELEVNLIRVHPEVAYNMLRKVNFPWPIAQIIYQHHERVNGTGYPLGISGDQMLFEAKIIAVSDVVEAIASHRPYRPALGLTPAIEEISKNKGTLYDGKVVDTCIKLFRENRFEF